MDLEQERHERIERALDRLRGFDATWADMFRDYVLEGMYERTVLDQRTRELCAIAALTVLDRQGPLRDHIKGALRHGATHAEVIEAIVQTSVYGGFPTALAGLGAFEQVLAEIAPTPTED